MKLSIIVDWVIKICYIRDLKERVLSCLRIKNGYRTLFESLGRILVGSLLLIRLKERGFLLDFG